MNAPAPSPTNWKDVLDVATKIAALILAAIAVTPALRKVRILLTTQPRESDTDREARIKLMFDGRMGWFQRWWTNVLWWFRKSADELLTWKERRARYLWCPIIRHKWGFLERPNNMFHARCKRCRSAFLVETEEGLERARRQGRPPFQAERTRYRDEDEDET